jgi:hyperosmotically inducible protein
MPRRFTHSFGTLFGVLLATSSAIAIVRAQLSEDDLRDHIAYHLETNAMVKKYDITVKVEHHDVTLLGTVATDAQKSEAGKLAKIDGVGKVDNQIAVDRDADRTLADRAKRGMRRTGDAIDDGWITTKVKWFLTGDSLLKGSNISVETKDRVVVLTGTVKTETGRKRAIALANDTDGVSKVVDHLTIDR